MGAVTDYEKVIWSLSASGIGTTISGNGNSGPYTFTPPADQGSSPVDLGEVTDVGLFVNATGKTGSPSMVVSLGVFTAGVLFPSVLATAAITATGPAAPAYGGVRAGSSNYFVLPHYGQVAWTITGGSFTGVEITLIGR